MSVERNLPLIRERKQAILKGEADRAAEQRETAKANRAGAHRVAL